MVGGERGLSTRFPRFLRVREDKGVEEATEAGELAEMFWKQEGRGRGAKVEGEVVGEVEEEEEG